MTEETKVCSKCGETKSISLFRRDRNICKECHNKIKRLLYQKNKEHILSKQKQYHENNKNEINKRQKNRYYEKWEEVRGLRKCYYLQNRDEIVNKARLKRHQFPERTLLSNAKRRAKEKGLDFNITIEDIVIPEVCPVLGIPIKVSSGKTDDTSPSLDRIDNTKGYVKGNVRVISFRANVIKNNATIEDIRKILEYMEREASHTPQP